MKPPLFFLEKDGFRLPYRKYGQGHDLLLAFHGYGQKGDDFAVFETALGSKYTILAFDFFYHGDEPTGLDIQLPPFTSSHLAAMVEQLLWEQRKVSCSMIGYSQGGRLVLGIIHRMPQLIHEIFLIAPDGLKPNYLHKFISGTLLGKKIGWFTVQHPKIALNLVHLFHKAGFMHQKVRQLIFNNLEDKSLRLKVYRTWLLLQKYHPNLNLVKHYLNTRPIRLEMIFGKYDTIIPVRLGKLFIRPLKGKVQLHILESGHQLLLQHEEISKIILDDGKLNQK